MTDVTVRRLGLDDWRTYRDIRLAMLQESPEAFGSRYADAVDFDEQTWRGRLTSCEHHLAELDGRPVGSAGLGWQDGEAHLIGMWVDPACRRQHYLRPAAVGVGRGRALVHAHPIDRHVDLVEAAGRRVGQRHVHRSGSADATAITTAAGGQQPGSK